MKMEIIYRKELSFSKEIEDGKNAYADITIELRNKKEGVALSIVGDIYHTNKSISCGQCVDYIREEFADNKKVQRICDIWDRWHLNDLHAGCEHQREFENEPYENHRGAYCEICDYTYGTGWKFEVIPNEIIEEIKSW
jgi:hypothetical protein